MDQAKMTLEDVDREIAAADQPGVDRGKIISDIQYFPDLSSLDGKDPFSAEYKSAILEIFNDMKEGGYCLDDEAIIFDSPIEEPSPYNSHHPAMIGGHLAAIATLVRHIDVLPPGRVLDMGFGTGDTSLLLARCGFHVDAVDVNPRFIEMLTHWKERVYVGDKIKVLQTDYDSLEGVAGPYDAITFFESFHHSLNHVDLLKRLTAMLKPGGAIIFAGEPIYDHFSIPWGLRHDEGLATYCIRKMGWMELGFNTQYFLELLEKNGLCATRRTFTDYPVANHFRAMKALNNIPILGLCLSDKFSQGWHPADGKVRWTKGSAILPLAYFKGANSVSLTLSNHKPADLQVAIYADGQVLTAKVLSPGEHAVLNFTPPSDAAVLTIGCDAWSPSELGYNADGRKLGVAVHAIDFHVP
ncbi:hypothetical protein CRT23_12390 [Methylobacterium sp. V23]|nr:hypothetical protein CRT23_12390 [Methylobacterium sp. V23]